jgi:5,6-dimethylbenzimidazole synthase
VLERCDDDNQAFSPEEKQGLYRAIFERRDVRSQFRPDPIPRATLTRVLAAAHHAPSVGFMQPWDFIVIDDPAIRAAVKHMFMRENARAATNYTGEQAVLYRAMKLEGILDSPLNLCVTCDRTRGGPHVLGRNTILETDLFSVCLAVQNLWLAARAENLGVGWVSILDPVELAQLLGLPAHVQPVAYLCLGYVREFLPEPELQQKGWRARLPLETLVHHNRWGTAMPDCTWLGAHPYSTWPLSSKEPSMTTAPHTKLLRQETIEQLDGTKTILSYFEPTEETMRALVQDLFEHNWQRIVVGPCIQGAVFEICFQQPPKLSYLDGYLTVNLGPWHFHLCIGTHTGASSEELRRKRPVAKIAFFEERGRGCAGGRSWGLQMWNGFGEQMTTVFLPNPFLSDEQKILREPQWERLRLWYELREKYLGEPMPQELKPADAPDENPFLHGHDA